MEYLIVPASSSDAVSSIPPGTAFLPNEGTEGGLRSILQRGEEGERDLSSVSRVKVRSSPGLTERRIGDSGEAGAFPSTKTVRRASSGFVRVMSRASRYVPGAGWGTTGPSTAGARAAERGPFAAGSAA